MSEKWNLRRLARLQTDGLEELVRLRTSEMMRINRSKSEFLANISHELLTPLNGVLGMAHLLEGTPLNEDQRDLVGDVQRSGQRLLGLVQDVLMFNAVESGKLQLKSIPYDVGASCQAVVDTFASKARAKGLELKVFVDPHLPAGIVGDPEQVRHILALLLENAVTFTDRGAVSVRVRLVETLPPALQFDVTDTGHGLAPEGIELLKHPFLQVDGGATRTAG